MSRLPRTVIIIAILLAISVLWPVSAQFGTTIVNLLQLNGTTVDTNSGNVSNGTQRVVLATDQVQLTNALKVDGSGVTQPVSGTVAVTQSTSPWIVAGGGTAGTAATGVLTVQGIASMTKLLVTPDSVALPANQSVNVAQIAGTTTDTNSGNKSAGTQRMVIATDQPNLTTALNVADATANKVIWGSAQTVVNTAVDVAAAAYSVTTTTFDNTTDSVVPYATRALAVGQFPDWAAAPVAGTTIDLYCTALNIDGTSDETDAGGAAGHYMGSWYITNADALQRRAMVIDISWILQADCYFRNGTAQNMNNDAGTNATVKITPFVGRRTP